MSMEEMEETPKGLSPQGLSLIGQSVQARLQQEVVAMYERGTVYCFILGISAGALLMGIQAAGLAQDFELPAAWAVFCGVVALLLRRLVRHKAFWGPMHWGVFALVVSLPSLLYLTAHFVAPAGALTYMTGPSSHLYYLLILMTGFMQERRLSGWLGFLAGAEYFGLYLLAVPHLDLFRSIGDVRLVQDLTDPSVFILKSALMTITGLLTGILSAHGYKLFERTLAEEREKGVLDRLLGQYLSQEVKNKIIGEKREILGERLEVAVLFADIRGFTELCESRPPEDVVRLLNRYFNLMVGDITRAGGVVDKFIGDAVMAVFGGVVPLEHPADQALKTAQQMRQSLGELNRALEAEGLAPLENGIGIHFGWALQGNIGSNDRKEFTVIGAAVNLAARLEGLTKCLGVPILISKECQAALSAELQSQTRAFGPQKVRGIAEPVEVFGVGQ